MDFPFAIIPSSFEHSFYLNQSADKAVYTINPLAHELLVAEVLLTLFLSRAMKGILNQNQFTSAAFSDIRASASLSLIITFGDSPKEES